MQRRVRRSAGRTIRRLRNLPLAVRRCLDRAKSGSTDYWNASDGDAARLAFSVLLRREPLENEVAQYAERLERGVLNRHQLIDELVASDEFAVSTVFGSADLGPSLHFSRGIFVRSLPAAKRILDLGGTHRTSQFGAMVVMGYPHRFEELVVVDLPPEDRHDIYRTGEHPDVVTHLGPVRYQYHSMVDLSAYESNAFDLVYSGQTIEHVTPEEADKLLLEVHRVLRDDGWFALDTPNAAICRLQQADFIDPDHKIEYTHAQLVAKLTAAGFVVERAAGLNDASRSVAARRFLPGETSRAWGVFDSPEQSYLLAYVCRKRLKLGSPDPSWVAE